MFDLFRNLPSDTPKPKYKPLEKSLHRRTWENQKGTEGQHFSVSRDENGMWRIHEDSWGPTGLDFFGKEDNEWWLDLDQENMDLLSLELLKLVMNGTSPLTITGLQDVMDSNGIKYEKGGW
jgi:hypothetical protein